MSQIHREDLERVARLAALDLEPTAIPSLAKQIQRILEYVSQLEAAEGDADLLDGPLNQSLDSLRADVVRPATFARSVAANAPAFRDGLFVVPRLSAMERE